MSHTRQGFPAGPETSRRGPERVGHRLVRIYIYLPTLGATSAGVPAVPPPRSLAVCLGLTRQQSLDCPDAARPLLYRTPLKIQLKHVFARNFDYQRARSADDKGQYGAQPSDGTLVRRLQQWPHRRRPAMAARCSQAGSRA